MLRPLTLLTTLLFGALAHAEDASFSIQIVDTETTLRIETPQLSASVNKRGYVSGSQRQSFRERNRG